MNVAEIKSNIINKITSTEDLLMLEQITEILGISLPKKEIYVLTDEQLIIVNESSEQFRKGDFLTEEEAENDIQKWLKDEENRLV
jgi:predicted subunit of tRNA(5-methylaminomethyl-2-thiouridylate) methyltransferase